MPKTGSEIVLSPAAETNKRGAGEEGGHWNISGEEHFFNLHFKKPQTGRWLWGHSDGNIIFFHKQQATTEAPKGHWEKKIDEWGGNDALL